VMNFLAYPDYKPSFSAYYFVKHVYEEKTYYKALWWNSDKQEWYWKVSPTVISFVPDSRANYYTECLEKARRAVE